MKPLGLNPSVNKLNQRPVFPPIYLHPI